MCGTRNLLANVVVVVLLGKPHILHDTCPQHPRAVVFEQKLEHGLHVLDLLRLPRRGGLVQLPHLGQKVAPNKGTEQEEDDIADSLRSVVCGNVAVPDGCDCHRHKITTERIRLQLTRQRVQSCWDVMSPPALALQKVRGAFFAAGNNLGEASQEVI